MIPLLLFVSLDASKSADLEEKSNLALKEFTIKRIFGSSRQSAANGLAREKADIYDVTNGFPVK